MTLPSRDTFTRELIGRLRFVLQKHEREATARGIVALKKEELEILKRLPEQLPKLYELRHAALAAAERQLVSENATLDAALIELADVLYDALEATHDTTGR